MGYRTFWVVGSGRGGGEEIKIRSIQTPKFIRTQIILDFNIIDINMTIFPFAYKKVTKELHRSLLLVRHMHEDNSNIDHYNN